MTYTVRIPPPPRRTTRDSSQIPVPRYRFRPGLRKFLRETEEVIAHLPD